jgi:hypothetical protein
VLTVHPTNSNADYSTIQAAIDAAIAGDAVLVCPATYNEVVTMKNGISLTGLIDASGALDSSIPVIVRTFTADGSAIIVPAAILCGISNIRIVAQTSTANIMVGAINAASALVLSGCYVEASYTGAAVSSGTMYAMRQTSGSPTLDNNTFLAQNTGAGSIANTTGLWVTGALVVNLHDGNQFTAGVADVTASAILLDHASATLLLFGNQTLNGALSLLSYNQINFLGGSFSCSGDTSSFLNESTNAKVNDQSITHYSRSGKNDMFKLRLRSLTSDPSDAANGNSWYRSDLGRLRRRQSGITADLDRPYASLAVRVASTVNIATLSGLLTVDGITLVAGDRVLVKNQSTGAQNGVYVAASGAWSYASDWSTGVVQPETLVQVSEGTQQHTLWALSTQGAITVGTTALTFAQFTGGVTTPGAPVGSVQYNNAGVFSGMAKFSANAVGYPTVGEASGVTAVNAPAAGSTLLSRFKTGRRMAAQIGPLGGEYCLQPSLFAQKIGWLVPYGNVTTINAVGLNNTTTGTATLRSVATTTFATSLRQLAYVSSTTAGTSCGVRNNALQFYCGDVAGRGGFFLTTRIVIDTTQTNMRWFVGMYGTAAVIGNVNPSTLANILGFGIDSGQTTVRFFHNDSAGTATAIDMGASFPATTANVVYDLRVFCAPNGSVIYYSIERLDSAAFAEGNVSTNIPTNTTLLSPQVWMNNGTTAAAVAVSLVNQYIETDN